MATQKQPASKKNEIDDQRSFLKNLKETLRGTIRDVPENWPLLLERGCFYTCVSVCHLLRAIKIPSR